MATFDCPLCASGDVHFYHEDLRRRYFQCAHCHLVSVEASQLPSLERERAEYSLHQNSVDDPAYRAFLSRAFDQVVTRVKPHACGLDFGCGPGPALAAMFSEAGYEMAVYDPSFADDPSVLHESYDFVTCTEVIEHVHQPKKVWGQLISMLKTPGWLVVMTKRVTSQRAFRSWHYKNDVTHVGFYSEPTLRFVADLHSCSLELVGADLAVFGKSG